MLNCVLWPPPILKTGVENDILWSEIGSGFEELGGTPPTKNSQSTLHLELLGTHTRDNINWKKKCLGLGMSLGSVSHEVDYLRAFKGTCSLQPSYVLLHTVSIKVSLQMLIGSLIVIAKSLYDRLVFVFGCFMSQDTLTTSVTLSFIVYFSRVSDWGRKNYHVSITRNFNQPQYTSKKDTASISYHAIFFRFSRD